MLVQHFLRRLRFADLLQLLTVDQKRVLEVPRHLQNCSLAVNAADNVLQVIVISDQILLKRTQPRRPLFFSNVSHLRQGPILKSQLSSLLLKIQYLKYVVNIKDYVRILAFSCLEHTIPEVQFFTYFGWQLCHHPHQEGVRAFFRNVPRHFFTGIAFQKTREKQIVVQIVFQFVYFLFSWGDYNECFRQIFWVLPILLQNAMIRLFKRKSQIGQFFGVCRNFRQRLCRLPKKSRLAEPIESLPCTLGGGKVKFIILGKLFDLGGFRGEYLFGEIDKVCLCVNFSLAAGQRMEIYSIFVHQVCVVLYSEEEVDFRVDPISARLFVYKKLSELHRIVFGCLYFREVAHQQLRSLLVLAKQVHPEYSGVTLQSFVFLFLKRSCTDYFYLFCRIN